MRWPTPLALAALSLSAAASPAADVTPAAPPARQQHLAPTQACAGLPQVKVQAEDARDAATACEGATRALGFLAQAGLSAPPDTRIDIVAELPGELAGRAVGCYLRESRKILLLSYGAFQSGGGWFRMPPSQELYRAAASHEVAHAVVGCHAAHARLAVAAHEYVAYVVFFATMEPQLRSDLLRKFPGTGFKTTGQISDVSHIVNPNQFGVDAWQHYLKTDDRAQWLRRIIAGEVVPEPVDDPGASER